MMIKHDNNMRWTFRVLRLPALGLALALLSSCSGSDCAQAVLPSFSVTVVDAVTDENLASIATGTIVQGTFSAAFSRVGNRLVAGENRSGTFTVTVSAPGYQSWEEEIVVASDGCLIHTQELRVDLVPE